MVPALHHLTHFRACVCFTRKDPGSARPSVGGVGPVRSVSRNTQQSGQPLAEHQSATHSFFLTCQSGEVTLNILLELLVQTAWHLSLTSSMQNGIVQIY